MVLQTKTTFLVVLVFVISTFSTSCFSIFYEDRFGNPTYHPTFHDHEVSERTNAYGRMHYHKGYDKKDAYNYMHYHKGYDKTDAYNYMHYHTGFDKNNAYDYMHGLSSSPHRARVNPSRRHRARSNVVNVEHYKQHAKGRNDDTEAFKKAWDEACSSGSSVIVVPNKRTYNLKPLTFSGPCRSGLTMKIYGTIKASTTESDYKKDRMHWILFQNVDNFRVEGGGIINGNGHVWWKKSCKVNMALPCTDAPTAVTFMDCKNVRVADLWFQDAQKMHLTFQRCTNVNAYNLMVTAPGDSPNTDGIHVTETRDVEIANSVIRTGDDCISIVSGSNYVTATDITCGPGHGISIGSLGADNSAADVSNVEVNRARLSGTMNGVRIKTWQGGKGYARNIKFENIFMYNVSNPIIIDQFYCDQTKPCPEQSSAVQISNVVYKNIRGTSASGTALNLNCSRTFPCHEVVLEDVNLKREGEGTVDAACVNVQSVQEGKSTPQCS